MAMAILLSPPPLPAGAMEARINTDPGNTVASRELDVDTSTRLRSAQAIGSVVRFRVINADTNLPIASLDSVTSDVTLNLATLPTTRLSIEAITTGTLGSLKWQYGSEVRTENSAAWVLCGNVDADIYPCPDLIEGFDAVVTATPYSLRDNRGTAGTPFAVRVRVIRSTGSPPPPPVAAPRVAPIAPPMAAPRAAPVVPKIVTNEVMKDPSGTSGPCGRWIELYNAGSTSVDLMNWTIDFSVLGQGIVIDKPSVLLPGAFLVIGRACSPDQRGHVYPDFYTADAIPLGTTPNSIKLLDATRAVVDSVDYGTFPFTVGTSLALKHPSLDNSVAGNWFVSPTSYGTGGKGTPGATNDCAHTLSLPRL
jgi:Lamin Tail Domain